MSTSRTFRHEREEEFPRGQHIRHNQERHIMTPMRYGERDTEREIARHKDIHITQERTRVQERRVMLTRAKNTLKNETSRYDRRIKDYLEPILQSEEVIENAAETFLKLDEDPRFLATSSAAFLEGIQGLPDDLDDEVDSEAESMADVEEDDDPEDLEVSEPPKPELRTAAEKLADVTQTMGFMQWNRFRPYPLSKDSDIVGDQRKSFLSYAQSIELGINTPVVGVTTKGLFGILVRLLQPKDYRAYFKASARLIYLPDSISRIPDELELEAYERNLLGTGKFLGSNSSMMTCLTYNDDDYGTITLFKVDFIETAEGQWPERIRPVAAMIRVPKKLLKKTAKSVPRSKRTKLQVKAKAIDPLEWLSFPSETPPKIANSPHVHQEKMPQSLQEALVMNPRELKTRRSKDANIAIATIPAMIAWMHVKASYLEDVDMEGTEVQRRKGDVKVRRIVRWRNAPKMVEHEGDNPCIIILHPEGVEWVTAPVYWG